MAVIKALFVVVGGRPYAIPVSNIDRLVTIDRTAVKSALGREAIVLDRQEVPIVRLDALFHGRTVAAERQSIVIIRRGNNRVGVAVDTLASTEEVVIKPLSRLLRKNRFFAGSALIGSGEVALVLDATHLVTSGTGNLEQGHQTSENKFTE